MVTLKELYEYFPTSVYTGKALVFISEDWKIELTEHQNADFSKRSSGCPIIRVKVFKKALNGEFLPGHYEDFQIDNISELASQIERYIQAAVGRNIREYPENV
ncbi:MAG: hypothetical protein A2Y12_18670 [Planctomycetes bacterium GWF2_42_9]|jgi:hypothetical protein|nr:MAG: hypothetical protein A2Y12_18670 [Planctomycetes bacterium GWF2_42_9]HAL45239.1 hypothetical protein [Phycisphaerales bacterium]